jgi:hypothetical protein
MVIRVYPQKLSVEQISEDIDSGTAVLTCTHTTFNGSVNKEELLLLRDTIDNPMTGHDLFRILQPLVALDGHTSLQFNGTVYPHIEVKMTLKDLLNETDRHLIFAVDLI